MRSTLATQLEREIAPLCEVHGVELVAVEWFQGAGRGLLRVTVDRKGGDPRVQDPNRGVAVDVLTHITRDVSASMDALEEKDEIVIDVPYQLEVTSPGPERPLQKRADFDRFVGLRARIDMAARFEGPSTVRGALDGTSDGPKDRAHEFIIRVSSSSKTVELPSSMISRARLEAIIPEKPAKPGKAAGKGGASKRQERIEARDRARAINDEHLRRRAAGAGADRSSHTATSASVEGVEHDAARAASGAER
jgi:ribosome maturation factor RimP